MKSLFITKEEGEIVKYIDELKGLGFTVRASSFLEFIPVYSSIQQHFEVIFFSSPRSVIFYLGQYQIPKGTMLACAGKQTAEILLSMGYSADFTGEKSGDMCSVASELKTWCGDRRVLFPISDRSLRTVSVQFDASQKEELTVYETRLRRFKVAEFSHYVFTSPSNVEGFFQENSLPENSTVIAWGKSTQTALEKIGTDVQITLSTGSMNELIEVLR